MHIIQLCSERPCCPCALNGYWQTVDTDGRMQIYLYMWTIIIFLQDCSVVFLIYLVSLLFSDFTHWRGYKNGLDEFMNAMESTGRVIEFQGLGTLHPGI
jgi:hypothetical protein